MSTFFYTGLLTDLGVRVLNPDYRPKLTVRPEVEAFGPNGIVSDLPVPVTVNATTGAFSMELIPSHQLSGRATGVVGVKYVLQLEQFDDVIADDFPAWNEWHFTAVAGGGPIKDMAEVPPFALYVGPPWPSPLRPGIYWDTPTDDVAYYMIGA